MFGESDSESPQAPNPWDSLVSAPSPLAIHTIPKLVPEVEEGNVEYKLQLLSPSPARFARLVTQLQWRLLEGGGKAYYEIGVADSGALVGLPREQLEESLETLDMMAGEIGASVIVVKEVDVHPELSGLAESHLERWNGKKSIRRKDLLRMKQDASPTVSATEFETELASTDFTDTEESTCHTPATPPPLPGCYPVQLRSPTLLPFDPALAMFATDVGEDIANYADNEAPDDDVTTDFVSAVSVSLAISFVYKPRPTRKRAIRVPSPPPTHFEYAKSLKDDYPLSNSTDTSCHPEDSMITRDSALLHPQPNEAKAQFRRDKRGKRRGLKHNSPLTHVPIHRPIESPTNSADHRTVHSCSTNESNPSVPVSLHINVVDPITSNTPGTTTVLSKEPRLIVEALVVWELSSEEAFLDLEGFSL